MATVDKILTLLEKQLTGEKEIKGFQGLLKPFNSEMKKWSDESRTAISATAGLADAVMGLGSMAGSAIPPVGRIVIELTKTIAAVANIGVNSARARWDQQIEARSVGTTAPALKWLTNFFKIFKLDKEQAEQWAKTSAESTSKVVRDAQRGDKQAIKTLKLANVQAFDTGKLDETGKPIFTSDPTRGKARDSAQVAAEAIRQQEIFRRKAEDAKQKKNWEEAKKWEERAEAANSVVGLDRKQQAHIQSANIDPGAMSGLVAEQNKESPIPDSASGERAKALSEVYTISNNRFGAVGNGINQRIGQLGEGVADFVAPIYDGLSKTSFAAAKAFSIIPETESEKKSRIEREQAFDSELRTRNPRLADYIKNKEYGTGLFDMGMLKDSGPEKPKTRQEQLLEFSREAASGAIIDLDRLMAWANSDEQIQKAQVSADQTQQAGYNNIGNDQRQMPMTVNMTITANTPSEIVSAVQQGIGMGTALSKESNTSTAASPNP